MTTLTNLIARLEAAEEGSRELDAEIARAVNWQDFGLADAEAVGFRYEEMVPAFSTSLDAALSLVLPLGDNKMRNFWLEEITLDGHTSCVASVFFLTADDKYRLFKGSHRVREIAAVIAALRTMEDTNER